MPFLRTSAICSIPMCGLADLSRISTTSPSAFLGCLGSFRNDTLTVSPLSACLVFLAGTNMSSSRPSTLMNAYPSLVMPTLPTASSRILPDFLFFDETVLPLSDLLPVLFPDFDPDLRLPDLLMFECFVAQK